MRRPRPVTEVPDVVGLSAEDACEIIRRAGLVPVGPEGTERPRSGVIALQRPIGNAGAEQGAEVALWTHPGKDTPADLVNPDPVTSGTLSPV